MNEGLAPTCSAQWIVKVEADHQPAEEDHALRASIDVEIYRDEALTRVRELLTDRQLRLRTRVDGLSGLMDEDLFRTSFAGGVSGGVNDLATRIQVEANVLGVDRDAAIAERPAYGYLQGTDETGNTLNSYGSVLLVLSTELTERTTIVFGDSMGTTYSGTYAAFAPSPLSAPSLLCTYATCELRSAETLANATDPTFRYAELQIYGGISQRDISFVVFSKANGPDEALSAALEHAGIDFKIVSGFPT
jgi:hypothetical protein